MVPQLNQEPHYRENGIGKVYSRQGFRLAWDDYQVHLINRLNDLTAGTPFDGHSLQEIVVMTSRRSEFAALFNYASAAHNNHFFFESLTTSVRPIAVPQDLEFAINQNFTSMDNLKSSFLTTAEVVFSNAFVWLVATKQRDLKILVTYNAGTPYSDAHRRQSFDTNTTTPSPDAYSRPLGVLGSDINSAASGDYTRMMAEIVDNSKVQASRDDARQLKPLLCVNVWEHAYMLDYGISGKRRFLEAWWDAIDWSVVDQRAPSLSVHSATSTVNRMFLR